MSTIFDKFASFEQRYQLAETMAVNPVGVRFDEVLSPTRARVAGREVLLAGTSNYLGLTFDEDSRAAAKHAIDLHGTGTTGSRMANGSYASHQDLERDIAEWLEMPSAIVFTTGYQTNLGVLGTIAGKDDLLVIDADSHASIYDACKMSEAPMVRFKHDQPEDLDKKLAKHLPGIKGHAIVVIEGLYSMFGDRPDVGAFADVCEKHGAYLFVDEAHSTGVYGHEGRGTADEQGQLHRVDFYSSTFSKSLGTVGGFCASKHPSFSRLRGLMRSYTFTASPVPAVVGATTESLKKLRAGDDLRAQLLESADRLHEGLTTLGFEVIAPAGPVLAVRCANELDAVMKWQQLLEAGVYVNLAVPPATPKGAAILRISLTAKHTAVEVDEMLSAFASMSGTLAVAAE